MTTSAKNAEIETETPVADSFGIKRSQVQILSPRLSQDKDLGEIATVGAGGLDNAPDGKWIYALRDKVNPRGPVKFGIATDVEQRFRHIQTGNHRPLLIVIKVPGDAILEQSIHRILRPFKLNGEWFKTSDIFLTDFARQLKLPNWRDSIRRIGAIHTNELRFLASEFGQDSLADFARHLLGNAVHVAQTIDKYAIAHAAMPPRSKSLVIDQQRLLQIAKGGMN